jgi:hypothetical protein
MSRRFRNDLYFYAISGGGLLAIGSEILRGADLGQVTSVALLATVLFVGNLWFEALGDEFEDGQE